jgi:pimeloyl-ACP methyl ester carboxylesterase
MRRFFLGALCSAAAAASAGCERQPYLTPERQAKGLVVVLPGVEGRGPLNEGICRGLNAGGVDWGIDLEDWTSPLGLLYNLRAELHNRQKANRIAIRIAEYKFAHPDNPVVLIGQSGGGGMALWIAEAMPEGQYIDGLILLAPAISPGYMVDFALSKTRLGVLNFYSERDWLFLGLVTTLYGTMDGEHSASAGRVGFLLPPGRGRPKEYDRLFQIAWHKQMAAAGHTGGHLATSAEGFVKHYVAPFVLAKRWDEEVIAGVLTGRRVDTSGLVPMERWTPMPGQDWPAPEASRPRPKAMERRAKAATVP